MADKNLVMTFLNAAGSRASITIPAVRDDITESEVAEAMDVIIEKSVFFTSGGDLLTKHSAQVTERNVVELDVM